tara:strand:- start:12 stop:284 length:273 start_codon:yes stop_codon:yes gene_type:complete
MSQGIWHPNKVAWRCRRGLWELDVILQEFFDKNYHNLSSTEKSTFQWVLIQNDPYLQQLLVHRQQDTSLNAEQQKLIGKIIQLTNKASKP